MRDKLRFGTGGSPMSTPDRNTINGLNELKRLGLENLELEFVRNVFLKEKSAAKVKKVAEETDIALTAHGSYYINLNSKEEAKIEASKKRIFSGANMADKAGARSITFHPAYYQGMDKEQVYKTAKKHLIQVRDECKDAGMKIMLRPETTGKGTQFGHFKELTQLGAETGCLPCVDFAHIHAREQKWNTPDEFHEIMTHLEKELDIIKNMHIHMSGIDYGEKGEKKHLLLEESDFQWRDLLKTWKEFGVKGVVVCESPVMEKDAKLMQDFYKKL